jgi:hypothetical protein
MHLIQCTSLPDSSCLVSPKALSLGFNWTKTLVSGPKDPFPRGQNGSFPRVPWLSQDQAPFAWLMPRKPPGCNVLASLDRVAHARNWHHLAYVIDQRHESMG